MYRTFRNPEDKIDDKIIIKDEDYNHIKNSLRLSKGDLIHQVIGDTTFVTKIEDITPDEIICKIIDEDDVQYESPLNITLYQCILKSDKNEYIIQKATELGVNRIVFVETERTVVKLDEKKWIKKQNRFEKIALESSKQSKRTSIPEIEGLLNIDEISNQDNSLSLVFYENETESIHSLLTNSNYKDINIFIGPEGGLSEENLNVLKSKGFKSVSLGNRILRADTAPICALSIIQYELGDIK